MGTGDLGRNSEVKIVKAEHRPHHQRFSGLTDNQQHLDEADPSIHPPLRSRNLSSEPSSLRTPATENASTSAQDTAAQLAPSSQSTIPFEEEQEEQEEASAAEAEAEGEVVDEKQETDDIPRRTTSENTVIGDWRPSLRLRAPKPPRKVKGKISGWSEKRAASEKTKIPPTMDPANPALEHSPSYIADSVYDLTLASVPTDFCPYCTGAGRYHVRLSTSDDFSGSLSNHMKCAVETFLKTNVDWWPFSPADRLPPSDFRRIKWEYVSKSI